MRFRTRIGSALLAVPLALALVASPMLAAAGPRLVLSPARGASGTVVTMTIKNCTDPRLWTEPTINGSGAADPGASGFVRWETQSGQYFYGYEPADAWVGSGTTWTTSFAASFPPGKSYVFVFCTDIARLVAAIYTVK